MGSSMTKPADERDHPQQQQPLPPPPQLKAQKEPLLTCVQVVVRRSQEGEDEGDQPTARELVGSLLHAVETINAFLDFGHAPYWTVMNACYHNHLWLLPRLASREPADMNVHHRAHQFSYGLMLAVGNGNLDMVQWLCCEYCPTGFAWRGIREAASLGYTHILDWLVARYGLVLPASKLMNLLRKPGTLTQSRLLAGFHEYCDPKRGPGRRQVAPENYPERTSRGSLQEAIRSGHVKIAQFFYDLGYDPDLDALGVAATSESLQMVNWVHQRSPEWIEKNSALHFAVMHGYFETVKWLHENCNDTWEDNAMDTAATRGRVDILQWLHGHYPNSCSSNAMDLAASSGHLEIVKWLHENRSEGCTANAMDRAVAMGDFDLVLFLHTHRSEGCTSQAAENAAVYKRYELFQWLYETYPDKVDIEAIKNCRSGKRELMTALFKHMG